MLLPFTSYIPPVDMLIMMAAIYYGANYGGTITSVLMNVPGEPSTAVTCIDGFQMTKQGRAAEALAIAAIGSFLAGTLSIVPLQIFAPALAKFALVFGPAEYTGLLFMSVFAFASFSSTSTLRGLLIGLVGMGLATIGTDPMTGIYRLAIGPLVGGLNLIPVMIGLFGVGEVLSSAAEGVEKIYEGKLGPFFSSRSEFFKGIKASVRGGVVGFIFGLLPGMVPAVTSFLAYDVEKRFSKYPERFGTGIIEGVAAPEAANNATAMAGFIPLLSLGIPTSPTLAILLASLMIYGLQPGPMLFNNHPEVAWPVIISMYIANVMLLVLNLPIVGLWARMTKVPYGILAPIILTICVVGAYTTNNMMWDVWVCLFFGLIGYGMRKYGLAPAPLILGLILGPMFEGSMRQALGMSGGSFWIFFTKPVSAAFILAGILLSLIPVLTRRRQPKPA
jgi:putative tricarboxylic transport membrane protein